MFELLASLSVLLLTRLSAFFYQKAKLPEHFGDDLAHLSMVQEYKRTGGVSVNFDWLYPLGESDYPTGFHYLIYKTGLSIECLENYGGVIPIFIDCLFIGLVAVVSNLFLGDIYWWIVVIPVCRLFFDHDGRSIHFSERAFGMLVGTTYLVCVFSVITLDQSDWLYLIALVSFALFSTSSKFAIQAVSLFTILSAFVFMTVDFLVVYFICFAITGLLTKGYVIAVYKGLIRHSVFYQRVLMHKHPTIKNHYRDLFNFIKQPIHWRPVLTNSLFKIVVNNPFNVAVIYLVTVLPMDPWLILALMGVSLTAVVSFQPLTFLGEPERYLEYSLIFSFITFCKNIQMIPTVLNICIICLAIFVFVLHYYDFRLRSNAQSRTQCHMPSLKKWFAEVKDSTILPIPFRYGLYVGYNMTRHSGNKILGMHANVGSGVNQEKFEALLGIVYPFPRNDIDQLISEYSVDYILIDKAAVAYLHKTHPGYYERFNKYDIVEESSIFMLVRPRYKLPI